MAERTNHGPIPGEHDNSTEAPTQPGIVGTTGFGVDLPPELTQDPTVNEEERRQISWESGGIRRPDAHKKNTR